jgi:hypothetical protein
MQTMSGGNAGNGAGIGQPASSTSTPVGTPTSGSPTSGTSTTPSPTSSTPQQ